MKGALQLQDWQVILYNEHGYVVYRTVLRSLDKIDADEQARLLLAVWNAETVSVTPRP